MAQILTAITPTQSTYTVYLNRTNQYIKGVYFLVNYTRGSGTETGISIKQQFKFIDDDRYRTRDYLDSAGFRDDAIEFINDTQKDFFIAVPNAFPILSIRLEFTFAGYTSGNYGALVIAHLEDVGDMP